MVGAFFARLHTHVSFQHEVHRASRSCQVETCEFYAYFQPELHQRGFEGIFSAKSRARTMHERDRKSVDGCAIFFRCDIFEKQKEVWRCPHADSACSPGRLV